MAKVRQRRVHRRGRITAVVLAAVLCVLGAPLTASPAGAVDGPTADWSLTVSTPERAQRVGRAFGVGIMPEVQSDSTPFEVETTYVVPAAFRIASAYVGDSDCDVAGQTITCDFPLSYLFDNGGIVVILIPVATGQNITSTITVASSDVPPLPEPDPDPTPNQVSFTNDVTPGKVDLAASLGSTPPGEVQIGGSVFFLASFDRRALPDGTLPGPIDATATLQLPPGFVVRSVFAATQPSLSSPPASVICRTVGRTVTCTGISLPRYDQRNQLESDDGFSLFVNASPTIGGPSQEASFTVSSTLADQTEVNPDPHPNTATTTVDVTSTDQPSSVAGVVTGPGGAALAGVDVLAYAPDDGFVPTAATTTSGTGAYTLPSLAPGSYALAYVPPAGSGLATQWRGGASSRATATPLVVDGSGDAIAGVAEQMRAPASIAGTVRGPGATPVAGATVRVFPEGSPGYFPSATVTTAGDGTYTLPGLAPGRYQVQFQPPAGSGLVVQWYDRQLRRGTADILVVAAGSAVTAVDGALTAAGTVSGQVDEGGLTVMAYAPGDTWIGAYRTTSGPDGSYVLGGLPAGAYKIAVTGPGRAPAWYGGPNRAAATELVLPAEGTLTGIDVLTAP